MKGKKRTDQRKRLYAYAAGAFAVVLLVIGAFLTPPYCLCRSGRLKVRKG
ncbi:hypothetical protein IMSAG185_01059 [Lachnospiraceae bacterium]|nr:hypothetical protein IMSAG185_01059 [Lachnospiraceae bacterium]